MKFALSWHEVLRRPLPENQYHQPMKPITTLIEDLTQIAEIDENRRRIDPKSAGLKKLNLEAEEVRERLPTAILKHYDQRISKGRRGAAKVRNGTCGGCHLSLPSGQLSDLRRADVALQVCGYCSIFLLPEDVKPEEVATVEAPAPTIVKKPAKRKLKAVT